MKNLRKLIFFVFILTLAVFGVYVTGSYLGKDTKAPVIKFDKDTITASIEDSGTSLLKGVSARDDKDGDVTDSLIVESMQKLEGNLCEVVYVAFDSSDNIGTASRTVDFEDYRSIHFRITAPMRFTIASSNEILNNITADDCIDGDLTNRIKLVNKSENSDYVGAGIYDYEFQVTNSIGDTAVLPVSVEFYTDSYEERLYRPNIYLKEYIVYLNKGDKINPKDYLKQITIGSDVYVFDENDLPAEGEEMNMAGVLDRSQVKVQSDVRTKEEGIYTVNYSYTTDDDHIGTAQLIVVVE